MRLVIIALVAATAVACGSSKGLPAADGGGAGGTADGGGGADGAPRDGASDTPADMAGGETGATAANRPERRDATDALIAQLRVPAGFTVRAWARGLTNPRMLAAAPDGSLYVTMPMTGEVMRLADGNGDGTVDMSERTVVASRTTMPELAGVHGIAINQGKIYLTSVKHLVAGTLAAGPLTLAKLGADLPDGGQHPNRTLAVGPDGKLYVSVGSTCNACPEPDTEHATMMRLNLDGTAAANPANPQHPTLARDPMAMLSPRVFASGLRNTIGFDWHPTTGELWGADHGSDGLGDDIPPDEIQRVEGGKSFGWPYCWGDRKVDPTVDQPSKTLTKEQYCATTAPPAAGFQAHSAPIAWVFYRGTQFPAAYQGDAFVALRGSWNRTVPTGYKVVRVHFASGAPAAAPGGSGGAVYDDFLSGFLIENGAAHFGRLAGLAVGGDGSLFVSEDTNGVIYQVRYGTGSGDGGAGDGGTAGDAPAAVDAAGGG